jgi:hypothetical protein
LKNEGGGIKASLERSLEFADCRSMGVERIFPCFRVKDCWSSCQPYLNIKERTVSAVSFLMRISEILNFHENLKDHESMVRKLDSKPSMTESIFQ